MSDILAEISSKHAAFENTQIVSAATAARSRILIAISQAEMWGFEGTKVALLEILRLHDEG